MIVKANTPLSDSEKRNVQRIATEANCINEAMSRTFGDGFSHYDESTDTAYFGLHPPYEYVYEIPPSVK